MSDFAGNNYDDEEDFSDSDDTLTREIDTVESQSAIEARQRLERYRGYFIDYGSPGIDYSQMSFPKLRELMVAGFPTLPLISKDTPPEEINLDAIKVCWIQSGAYAFDPLSRLFRDTDITSIRVNSERLKRFLITGVESRNSITIRMKLYNTLTKKIKDIEE